MKSNKIQMILHFLKEINVIMYIIEKKLKLNFNQFIRTNFFKKMIFQSLGFWNVL
jgi:hypothetical protein